MLDFSRFRVLFALAHYSRARRTASAKTSVLVASTLYGLSRTARGTCRVCVCVCASIILPSAQRPEESPINNY